MNIRCLKTRLDRCVDAGPCKDLKTIKIILNQFYRGHKANEEINVTSALGVISYCHLITFPLKE